MKNTYTKKLKNVIRKTLDERYHEIKSGKVKAIDGEEAFTLLRKKSESRRFLRLNGH